MQNKLENLYLRLKSVSVFENVASSYVMRALSEFIESLRYADKYKTVEKYSSFIRELFRHSPSLGDYLLCEISEDENVYVKARCGSDTVPECIRECAERELTLFSEISELTPEELTGAADCGIPLPMFEVHPYNFVKEYAERMSNIHRYGYGIFARYNMFTYSDGKIIPLTSSDKISVNDLIGYEEERGEVIENTLSLIHGKAASNILLYGDAGTGKSSTVKAVANMFADEGVRLIELRRDQIICIPDILDKLHGNPLKFILFIDDLSFTENDGSLGTLKAILEGSASARSGNTVIYVTSNRRHLVKETFSDRAGDDIHRRDTMQENISLSERFGITILFSRPDKKMYFEIVKKLAAKKNIRIPETELTARADVYALKKGGYSPRAAEQFTNILSTEI